ncbi:MAG: PD-(D/E)XK nuclease family protein, partial [Candidatus Angelobacter sp.]
TVEQARRGSTEQGAGAAALFAQVIRDFELNSADPVIVAFTRFVETWEEKPFIQHKSADEFLRYLDYFQQARGTVPLWTEDQVQEIEREHPEAVRLMTVHAAKGLEFDRVWILRVVSNAFPTNYREPRFEFPPVLRSSVAAGDSKEVHEQEERRLFYVAITRARDALAMHGRHGRSRDKTPTGFLRPLLADRGLGLALQTRETGALSGCGSATTANSAVADWLLLPPEFDGASLSLSANAVESYSTCPLKFKLERDWDIPGEVAASLQYGNAIHTVLRKYYVPKPGEPVLSTEDVIAAFKEQFDKPPIEDQVQRRLYMDRGTEQLRGLLTMQPRGSVDVIDAEVSFKFLFNGREIRGRIDRLDRIEGKKVRVIDYKTGVPKT